MNKATTCEHGIDPDACRLCAFDLAAAAFMENEERAIEGRKDQARVDRLTRLTRRERVIIAIFAAGAVCAASCCVIELLRGGWSL